MDKYSYKAVTANKQYKTILKESRNGINISEDGLRQLDETVSPLVLQGQSPYQILESHTEITYSAKTIYNYIGNGTLSVKNLDLPRKVKYKLRKPHKSEINDAGIFEGRTYKDFLTTIESSPDTNIVEMDTVVGYEGTHKVLLTLFFRNCKCMLIYLLPNKTTKSAIKVFNQLENKLTTIGFRITFPIILTDYTEEKTMPKFCISYCC